MKYIRKQIIETTVFEGDIKDDSTITSIFEEFKNNTSYLSIEYRDNITKCIKSYQNIKVKSISDRKISITVYTRSGILNIKNINYDDVITLQANVSSLNKELDKKVSRFDLLDIQ